MKIIRPLLLLILIILGSVLLNSEPKLMIQSNHANNSARLAEYNQIGGSDFFAFWSAYQVSNSGGNPYDAQTMLDFQKPQGWVGDEPQYFWSPPWVLTLLSPILQFSFTIARNVWLLTNILLVFLCSTLIKQSFHIRTSDTILLFSTVLFVPALLNAKVGQLGIFNLLGICLFIFFQSAGDSTTNRIKSGLALALFCVKPHVVLSVCAYTAILLLQKKRLLELATCVLVFLIFCLISLIIHSDVWISYLDYEHLPTFFITPTISAWLRKAMLSSSGLVPSWPLWLMPALGVMTAGCLAVTALKKNRLQYLANLTVSKSATCNSIDRPLLSQNYILVLILVPLTILTAPYCWESDYLILLPTYIVLLLAVNWHHPVIAWTFILLINLALFAGTHLFVTSEYFWLYPMIFLALSRSVLTKKTP